MENATRADEGQTYLGGVGINDVWEIVIDPREIKKGCGVENFHFQPRTLFLFP
jgi:hypothetical protein